MNPRDVVKYIEGEPKIGVVPTEPGLTNINGERVVGMNTENTEINEGTINFDIVFYVRMKDGLSQIMVNVEAQKDMPTEYHILNRAIFYACRLVSSQSLYVSPFYTDTSIELRTSLLPFWTSVASTDSLVTLSRMPVSNACPGFQFGLADFTAAYIAALYCPSYCSKVHVPLKRLSLSSYFGFSLSGFLTGCLSEFSSFCDSSAYSSSFVCSLSIFALPHPA